MLILLASIALATPCNDGWESSSSGSGTCSHHGGVSYGGYVPTAYVPPSYTTPSVDRNTLSFTDGVNAAGTHRWYSVEGRGLPPDISYTCYVDVDHNIGESIMLTDLGSWSPEDTKLVSLTVKMVDDNKILPIKYWFVTYFDWGVILTKSTLDMVRPGGEVDPIPLSSLQVSQIINSDVIFVGEDNSIRITIPNSFASAARYIWTKCNQ
jgi:hypothetical protein